MLTPSANRSRPMRKHLAAACLVTAALAGLGIAQQAEQRNIPKPAAGVPEAQPAKVPVKQVALFSSGVGYFEHFGSVQGNGSTELQFKTQQINDILKSLVLQ